MGMRFLGFHNKCARRLCSLEMEMQIPTITMKAILKHLELSTMELIITVRLCREVDLLERSCVHMLNPGVNPNDGQKICLRGSRTSLH
jgi:hypothetical protein